MKTLTLSLLAVALLGGALFTLPAEAYGCHHKRHHHHFISTTNNNSYYVGRRTWRKPHPVAQTFRTGRLR